MMDWKLKRLTLAMGSLQALRSTLSMFDKAGAMDVEEYRNAIKSDLDVVEDELKKLQLGGVTVFASIDRVRSCIKQDYNHQYLKDKLVELLGRLFDEFGGAYVFSLSQIEIGLFEPKAPLFGAEVAAKFPTAIYDIEEAGKCLALGRSTAAAFHAIRCLEAGIRAIARCLGIPDPTRGSDRSWNNMLRDISGEMEKRWPKSNGSSRLSGDGKFLEEAYGALAGMQNPYRNSTMHLDEKYTQDEALHIFEMCKGFMKKLATRMDENGLPLA